MTQASHSPAAESDRRPESIQRSDFVDALGCLALVLLAGAMIAVLVAAPHMIAAYFGYPLAILVALAMFPIWGYFGVKPGPSMIEGMFCLNGYGLLLGNLIALVILLIRSLGS